MSQILLGGTTRSHYRIGLLLSWVVTVNAGALILAAIFAIAMKHPLIDIALLLVIGAYSRWLAMQMFSAVKLWGLRNGVVLEKEGKE